MEFDLLVRFCVERFVNCDVQAISGGLVTRSCSYEQGFFPQPLGSNRTPPVPVNRSGLTGNR